jgi:hypothetical protein
MGPDSVPVLETSLISRWDAARESAEKIPAIDSLETGKVLYFRNLAFALKPDEQRFLTPDCADPQSKNVNYDVITGNLRGSQLTGTHHRDLASMLHRFATTAQDFTTQLLPAYKGSLRMGRTSYRPFEILGRETSPRKDDRRLHIDAFASSPVQGQRILRLFSNINPAAKPRVWQVGEPFDAFAQRFLPSVPAQWPLSAWLLHKMRITKSRRAHYDHIMLNLHDRAKLNSDYQRSAPRHDVDFPAGSTWMMFSDQVLHAALAGQFLLEQTFYLPVDAMVAKDRSPLRILEAHYGARLT